MDQNNDIKSLIGRLYKREFLSGTEISKLEKWLSGLENDQSFEAWLMANWQVSENLPVEISFDEILQLIRRKNQKRSWKSLVLNRFQRVAAILVVPLLIVSAVLLFEKLDTQEQWVSVKTAKGERTHVNLPDGSDVWLNVDSELKYSTTYGQTNRSLKLNGEAYFKVARQQKKAFLVQAKNFQVKAVGTEFGVMAYANEPDGVTILKEGIVDVEIYKGNKIRMQPGQKSIINSNTSEIALKQVALGNELEWMDDRLVFQNDDIPKVFRKIERWFNVSIKYDPEEFAKETLYVHLKRGETLGKILQIIDNAIGIEVKRNGNELLIEKKIKRANS